MQASFSRRKLVTPERMRELMQRSNLRGALQIGSHGGALVLSGTALWMLWGSWWAVPIFMIHGIMLNFLYAGQHELSHDSVFKTKWPNEWLGRLIGFLMLTPRDFDKLQHWAHHQHTQDWEKDGELVREPFTLTSYMMYFWGPSYWKSRGTRFYRFSKGIVIEPYIRQAEHAKVILEARVHVALYSALIAGSVVIGSWAIVILWLAPLVAMKPVHQLQNTCEHLGLAHNTDILDNTRSARTNAVMRWLCWQMPYHTAHHTFPSVPFWKLSELDAEIRDSGVKVHEMGWIEFQIEVIRKLWSKSEADYPFDEIWIVPQAGGQTRRVDAG